MEGQMDTPKLHPSAQKAILYTRAMVGISITLRDLKDFPGSSVVKNLPVNAGDMDSIPGLGRSSGEEIKTHSSGKETACQCRRHKGCGIDP